MPDYMAPPSTLPTGSTVWAYLRDSGGDSQEQSVPQQEAEIRAFCGRYELVMVHIFKDAARSGGSTAGREAFLDMVDMSGKADLRPGGLLLWNFARFARDMLDADFYKATLRKRGLIIHSLTDPLPEGPFAAVIEKLIDFSNEEKRRQNSRDVKRGLQAVFKQGYSFGIPPSGYKTESVEAGMHRNGQPRKAGRWAPDPDLWEFVKLAWRLRADGHTYGEIQERTEGKIFRSKNCWATFFRNKAYLGIGMWGELEIPNHHPAAVDRETWDAVQVVQAETRRPYSGPRHPRRTGSRALLSGLSFCSLCGAAIVKDKSHNWHYYICGQRDRKGKAACAARPVSARRAEDLVLRAVLGKVLTLEYLQDLLKAAQEDLSGHDLPALARQEEALQDDIDHLDQAIGNLLDLVEQDGAQAYMDRLARRKGERAVKAAELRKLEARRLAANMEISPEALELVLAAWRLELENLRTAGELRGLRKMLSRFVERIDLDYNQVVITYSFPLSALQGQDNTGTIFRGLGAQ